MFSDLRSGMFFDLSIAIGLLEFFSVLLQFPVDIFDMAVYLLRDCSLFFLLFCARSFVESPAISFAPIRLWFLAMETMERNTRLIASCIRRA